MENKKRSLTLITEENEEYFRSAIGEEFAERREDDLFIGVLDEEGAAAAAGAFREEGGILYLLRISSDERHRGKGYSYFLLEEMKKRAKASKLKEIATHLFVREGEEEGEWTAWLKRQGFDFVDLPAKRYAIPLSELYDHMPFWDRPLREGERIRAMKDQPYGFELLKNQEVKASLLAEPFDGNIYLANVSAEPGYFNEVKLLIDEALKTVKERKPDAKLLYTDIGSYRLTDYVERSLKAQGIGIAEERTARYAAVVLEEDIYE